MPGPAWVAVGDPVVVDPDITVASVTSNGIRVTLSVDESSFGARQGLWATTRLENVGPNVLHWYTDGCAHHVGVVAEPAVDWAYGAWHPEPFRRFKDWALEVEDGIIRPLEATPMWLATTPEDMVGRGEYGCADLAIPQSLEPGGRITARTLIEARQDRREYGPLPAVPVLLSATFGGWWRGREDPDTVHHEPIVADLPVRLAEGRDPRLLSPGQAIDVALGSDAFRALLLENDKVPEFAPTTLRYDVGAGWWLVGMTVDDKTYKAHQEIVVVDALDAIILSVLTGR